MARLDEADYRLLSILRRNGRAPYSQLARELGVTESAVRKRIRKLVRMGVIKGFTVEYTLPGELRAIILVKTQPPTPVPEVSRRIMENLSIERVMEVTGEYDIVAVARASSVDDVNRLIDYIRGIKGVASTYTMMVLRSY